MFKRDHVIVGIFIGLIISLGLYGIILVLDHFFGINHRLGYQILKNETIQIIAIMCNLPIIQITAKKGFEETSKGVIIAVMGLALIYAFENLI